MIFQILSIIALIFSVVGNIFINYKRRSGFVIWSISNTIWIIVNLISIQTNWPQVAMFMVYIVLNVHGFVTWKKLKRIRKKDSYFH